MLFPFLRGYLQYWLHFYFLLNIDFCKLLVLVQWDLLQTLFYEAYSFRLFLLEQANNWSVPVPVVPVLEWNPTGI